MLWDTAFALLKHVYQCETAPAELTQNDHLHSAVDFAQLRIQISDDMFVLPELLPESGLSFRTFEPVIILQNHQLDSIFLFQLVGDFVNEGEPTLRDLLLNFEDAPVDDELLRLLVPRFGDLHWLDDDRFGLPATIAV